MIPREVLGKVKNIEIMTRRMVDDVFSGEYHSIFKGLGMEFSEVREYQEGDDIRSIDWNVTARQGAPFIKKFVEERELTVMFMVDSSGSGHFGSVDRLKSEFAAEVCAVLAFSAIKNNDRVGLLITTDQVEKAVLPKKGRKHVMRVIREVLFHQPQNRGTDITAGIEHLMNALNRKAVIFLISDFLDEGYEKALRTAARRHDIIAVRVVDPREQELPDAGLVRMEDPESGRVEVVDLSSRAVRENFAAAVRKRTEEQDKIFRSAGVDRIDLKVGESYIDPLMGFFRMRAKKIR